MNTKHNEQIIIPQEKTLFSLEKEQTQKLPTG